MEINKAEITEESNAAMDALIGTLQSIRPEQINVVPFEGSWTAGQLVKHLLLSNEGFLQVMNVPVKDTERDPAAAVEQLKSNFLNFDIKMKSPAFVLPPEMGYEKSELLDAFQAIKEKAAQAVATLDLAKTCIAMELPRLGYLTRLEAIYFIIVHTRRHTHQLQDIHRALNKLTVVAG